MTTHQDEQFQKGDAGASIFEKVDTNRLKNGSLVMIKHAPCKVTDVSTAKPGKHGSAKVILKGKDILTQKVYECTYHAGDMVDAPIVARVEYNLLNIDDDYLELLDAQNQVKSDVSLPEDEHLKQVADKIKKSFEEGKQTSVVVLKTMGKEQVIDVKIDTNWDTMLAT